MEKKKEKFVKTRKYYSERIKQIDEDIKKSKSSKKSKKDKS